MDPKRDAFDAGTEGVMFLSAGRGAHKAVQLATRQATEASAHP